ncbi:hypothetical protein [Mesorhizobium sp. SARCC-RB16n]|uniref:hypothetical protein n=1 Tax=Mesorhizobium sp. SARCC-RB16n TaxID=2116687 RepID=UPI00166DCEF9|nr:hypothetical protein [Mesorhizobium sp. SARCC-RB16n]
MEMTASTVASTKAGLEAADGGEELAHVWIACFQTFRIELQVGNFVTGSIDLTMPELPFDRARGFKQILPGLASDRPRC